MDDIVKRARAYVAENAAENGADSLILDLCDEVESLRKQFLEGVTSILANVQRNENILREAESRLDKAGLRTAAAIRKLKDEA